MTEQLSASGRTKGRGEAKPPPPPPLSPQEEAALAFAQDNHDDYARRWRKKNLQHAVVSAEPQDDGNTLVTLTYRPAGSFAGRPGEELILITPNGTVVERTQVHAPRENFPWLLAVLAVGAVITAPVLIWFILTEEDRAADPLYVSGRILYMRVKEPEIVSAINYQNPDTEGNLLNWEIRPTDPNNVLAMMKVTLINQQTSRAVIVIDENAATLLTDDGRSYQPLNVVTGSRQIASLAPALVQSEFVGLWRTVTINAGENLTGWMVFEVPPGSGFREFRWSASDNMQVRFP